MFSWISLATAALKAVAAFFGFEQRQQDKQAGIDAQAVKDQGASINAAQVRQKVESENNALTDAELIAKLRSGPPEPG